MRAINIIPAHDTPGIILDAENNKFEITGQSMPADAIEFYEPIIAWLNEYSTNPNPETVLVFNLEYLNTSTSKIIVNMLLVLKKIYDTGKEVLFEWHFKEDDLDMFEFGEELNFVTGLPYNPIKH